MIKHLTILALLVVGCSPRIQTTSSVRDSVSLEIRHRIVAIHDTVHIEIPMISEQITTRGDSSILTNQYATSEAIIRPNGELYHTLETTPQRIATEHTAEVMVRDSIIYRDHTEIRSVEVERELTWWQRIQIKGFWCFAILIACGVIARRFLL